MKPSQVQIEKLDQTWTGRKRAPLMPDKAITAQVARNVEALLKAGPEPRVDRNFSDRLKLYGRITERQAPQRLTNDGLLDQLLSTARPRRGVTGA
jgi:hypothetical protein